MHRLLATALLLLPNLGFSSEVATPFFKVDLPDNYRIETNGSGVIYAYGGGEMNRLPILTIEFGNRLDPMSVIDEINDSIKEYNRELTPQNCEPNCVAYCASVELEVKREPTHLLHTFVSSKKMNFVISYVSQSSIEQARDFVESVRRQILQ